MLNNSKISRFCREMKKFVDFKLQMEENGGVVEWIWGESSFGGVLRGVEATGFEVWEKAWRFFSSWI
jgi:hypothetical protein